MATQQMQVVVPAGVVPGMPFQVNTPSGPMQVVCPEGATAGSSMIVNVPAMPVATAQPIASAAVMTAEPEVMMGTVLDGGTTTMGTAPMPQAMTRSEMGML